MKAGPGLRTSAFHFSGSLKQGLERRHAIYEAFPNHVRYHNLRVLMETRMRLSYRNTLAGPPHRPQLTM